MLKLLGHTSSVSCLSKGITSNTIISGSWDCSVRVWLITGNGADALCSTLKEIKDHSAAIWSVASCSTSGVIISASADKTIKMYNSNYECTYTFTGHTDCVRSVLFLNESSFLSCANDAIIKKWDINTKKCVREYLGHSNYIYAMAPINNSGGKMFASCGEDSSVLIWNGEIGEQVATLTIPAQSLWCITSLPNGDLVVGSSDGICRVFTTDSTQFAQPEILEKYENAVVMRKAQISETLGGIKKTE